MDNVSPRHRSTPAIRSISDRCISSSKSQPPRRAMTRTMMSAEASSASPGPRSYFAEFDRETYANYQWDLDDLQLFQDDIERRVKLLALLKGRIVIPASHLLESELAREFIVDNPAAVTRGIVVPALRD